MSYSNLAETILDYALAEAKRTQSVNVLPVHLLAGIRGWNSKKFDEIFPNTLTKIKDALAAVPSESAKPKGPDEAADKYLAQISNAADAWHVVETVLALDAVVNARPSNSQEVAKEGAGDGHSEEPAHPEVALSRISLDAALGKRIAAILSLSEREVIETISHDIAYVAFTVAGAYTSQEAALLQAAVDIALPESALRNERSTLMNQLGKVGNEEAGALARAYALGLVGVASFAASIDEQVTEKEVASIDELRMSLREELAQIQHSLGIAPKSNFDKIFGDVIGLETVKKELRQRIDYFTVVKRRSERGLSTAGHSMHMAFLGNPGTGKTTVARLFAKVLNEMNFLQSEKIVEVDRSGLVGEFVGHTEKKTNDVVNSALGGVLFIDEAYGLVDGYETQKGFGEEAIDVLVKRMEDERNQLMVVVAGYAEPMRKFLDSNEGLKSRIPLQIVFPDYSANELVEVAKRFANIDGFHMDDSCVIKFQAIASQIVETKSYANARDIRNMYERTVRNQFTRIAAMGELATTREMVTLVDLDVAELDHDVSRAKQIGFR